MALEPPEWAADHAAAHPTDASPPAAELSAVAPAVGDQPGDGSPMRSTPPTRGRRSRSVPPASPPLSTRPRFVPHRRWRLDRGARGLFHHSDRLGVRERYPDIDAHLRFPRAASRTPPRPRRGTAAERDSSPADWQDEQASAASAHGNAATNWSLLAPALIAPVRDFSFRTLSTEFLV